jgi:outer membrane lipoprotein-sorting protein
VLAKPGASHLFAVVLCALLPPAQAARAELTGEEILKRAIAVRDGVMDFTVTAAVDLHLQDSELPDNRARVYFKRPDKFRIEPLSGIVAIPKEALVPNRLQGFLHADADIKLVQTTNSASGKTYALQVRSRSDPDLGHLRVWVNGGNWTLERMEAYEAGRDRPVMRIEWQHAKVDGRYWMPTRITCQMDREAGGGMRALKGTAEIRLTGYRVNSNLPDKVFETPPARSPRRAGRLRHRP